MNFYFFRLFVALTMQDFTLSSQDSWLDHFLQQKLLFSNITALEQVKLISGDGFSISLPVQFLLASSSLIRKIYISDKSGQDVLLPPAVKGATLLLVVEMLRRGKTGRLGLAENLGFRLKEVQEVMALLQIQGCVALMRVGSSGEQVKSQSMEEEVKSFGTNLSKTIRRQVKQASPIRNLVTDNEETSLLSRGESTPVEAKSSDSPLHVSPGNLASCRAKKVKEDNFGGALLNLNEDEVNQEKKKENVSSEPNHLNGCQENIADFARIKLEPNDNLDCDRDQLKSSEGEVDGDEKNDALICHVCSKKCPSRKSWRNHIRSVHKDALFPCELCKKRFILEANMLKHAKEVHEEGRIRCEHCPSTYRNKMSLYHHSRKFHPDVFFSCQNCGKKFTEEINLMSHINSAHVGVHTCLLCSKVFGKMINLRRHVKAVHSEKVFACQD